MWVIFKVMMEDQPIYIPCMTLFWTIDVALCFFIKIFLMWVIFKFFIELVTVLLLVYVLIFLVMRHVES